MNNKFIVGVLVVLTLAVGYLFFGSMGISLGKASGPAHLQHESFLQGLSAGVRDQFTVTNTGVATIGTNGSAISELKATTCNLIGTNASQAASTTVAYDCAVTGVASGDVVMAMLASSTPSTLTYGWDIRAAKASSTAGYVTVLLYNGGIAAVPSVSSVGSSTNIWYMDN